MKQNTVKKVVSVEEHSVTFDRRDLREVMEQEDPEASVSIKTLVPGLVVDFGEGPQLLPSSRVMEMLRTYNADIPEDAEIVIAARWRREEEITIAQASAGLMQSGMPLNLPANTRTGPPPGSCGTCGGVPDQQGPTPECMDANGCARVRSLRGDLPIVRTVTPTGPGANVGLGGGAPGRGTQILTNRDTGQTAFADKEGRPYGVHDDYST